MLLFVIDCRCSSEILLQVMFTTYSIRGPVTYLLNGEFKQTHPNGSACIVSQLVSALY